LCQVQLAPALAELRAKFLVWKEQLLHRHPMAEAINYALVQWTELNVFCFDGAVPSTTTYLSVRSSACAQSQELVD
jgi:hypothetical protein